MVFAISYDLFKPGQDYADLYTAIKNLGTWCHPVHSTWYVKSALSAEQIRNQLLVVMDSSDCILVATVSAPAAWQNLEPAVASWLKSNL